MWGKESEDREGGTKSGFWPSIQLPWETSWMPVAPSLTTPVWQIRLPFKQLGAKLDDDFAAMLRKDYLTKSESETLAGLSDVDIN